MSEHFDTSKWVAFLAGEARDYELSDEADEAAWAFTDIVDALAERVLRYYPGRCIGDRDHLAFLAAASLLGHGVGLWEGREPWHEALHYAVTASGSASSALETLQAHVPGL